jgi:hypothetical protein
MAQAKAEGLAKTFKRLDGGLIYGLCVKKSIRNLFQFAAFRII